MAKIKKQEGESNKEPFETKSQAPYKIDFKWTAQDHEDVWRAYHGIPLRKKDKFFEIDYLKEYLGIK